jgi:hypothetical protein
MSRARTGLVAAIGDDHVAQPPLQVLEVRRQAQDRHDLGRHRDVKAGLARKAVGHPAERGHGIAQRPVVHVEHAAPGHPAFVDLQFVAPIDVVVDHRRQQVVGAGDRVEIAGEMEVHVLHRHDLRIAAAGGAALHPEVQGPSEASRMQIAAFLPIRFSPSPRPTVVVVLPSPAGVGLIAVTRISLPFGRSPAPSMKSCADLGLVMAVGQQRLGRDAQLRADLLDRLLLRGARDFDIGFGDTRCGKGRTGDDGAACIAADRCGDCPATKSLLWCRPARLA